MYLTYEEYQNMGGTLDAATFNDFEFEAEALINWYTFNRLKKDTTFPSEVKRLVKYLIDLAQQKANLLRASGSSFVEGSNAAITSQSNDGVSISYNVLSASQLMESLKGQEDGAINKYLQGVMNEAGQKLLYRGIYPGE